MNWLTARIEESVRGMIFDPKLDGLLDLLAEAVVRELQTQVPAGLAGTRFDVPLEKGDRKNEIPPDDTDSQHTSSS